MANLPAGLFHNRYFAFNCVLVVVLTSFVGSSLVHSKNSSSSDSAETIRSVENAPEERSDGIKHSVIEQQREGQC